MNTLNNIDFKSYLEDISHLESASMVPMIDASEAIWDRIKQGVKVFGSPTPWQKVNNVLRFRPAELSIWSGVNGHGKSMILSQCLTYWMHDSPISVASLEMPITALGERHTFQVYGSQQVPIADFEKIMLQTEGRYWVYDETDSVEAERILGMAIYSAKELGCKHIVIDSLVKCGLTMEQGKAADAQKRFVDRLCWIAKTYETHIHLVHHMRKGDSENAPGGKMDVKGAGEITDLADNVLLVWRNKPKEDALQENPTDLEKIDEPDALLTVAKQRHGEWEGKIKLWFDAGSKTYLQDRHDEPVRLI